MPKIIQGDLSAKGFKFGIVASRFNDFITARLLDGAVDALTRHGASDSDIEVVRVPGAYEIPLVAQQLARSKKYSAVICLGAVIRGATPHFEYVSAEVSKGIAAVSMETGLPVVFGVLTTDTIEQAGRRTCRHEERQQGMGRRPLGHRDGQPDEAAVATESRSKRIPRSLLRD
ncbi:MAG: 6,7-dimethyl-8-ribityllumazine synthase [Nitrospirae bacterium]|nr:6,7-dimethyl-8-ribityllumazine synthase [Nitrospirota bacterium]